jgi:hypothetical protein
MFENVIHTKGNKFVHIKPSAVESAQEELGIIFPKELKKFYQEIGYGFLKSDKDNFNRIMDPESICEFRNRSGQFAGNPELDIYADAEKDKLIFFEVCEGYYLSIGFSKLNNGKIYDGKKRIANDLKEFFERYSKNEEYFLR